MKKLLVRLRTFVTGSYPLVVGVLAVSNFVMAFSCIRSSRPQYLYTTLVVTNEVVEVVSNSFVSSGFPLSASASASATSSDEPKRYEPNEYPASYDYAVLSSQRVARMDGIYIREGDVTSRGIVLRIFPDRIFLHDGSCYVNNNRRREDDYLERRHREKRTAKND